MYFKRLKDLRRDNNLTQKQLAKIISIPQTSYSDYETRKTSIPTNVVIRLAKLYDVNINYIYGLTNIKNEFQIK